MKIALQIPLTRESGATVQTRDTAAPVTTHTVCRRLVEQLLAGLPAHYELWIDSECDRAAQVFADMPAGLLRHHRRLSWFGAIRANGDALVNQFALAHPEYNFFVRIAATAADLSAEVVRKAVDAFTMQTDRFDSMYVIAGDHRCPGSREMVAQDLEQTALLFAISREALFSVGCGVNREPLFFTVPRAHAPTTLMRRGVSPEARAGLPFLGQPRVMPKPFWADRSATRSRAR